MDTEQSHSAPELAWKLVRISTSMKASRSWQAELVLVAKASLMEVSNAGRSVGDVVDSATFMCFQDVYAGLGAG